MWFVTCSNVFVTGLVLPQKKNTQQLAICPTAELPGAASSLQRKELSITIQTSKPLPFAIICSYFPCEKKTGLRLRDQFPKFPVPRDSIWLILPESMFFLRGQLVQRSTLAPQRRWPMMGIFSVFLRENDTRGLRRGTNFWRKLVGILWFFVSDYDYDVAISKTTTVIRCCRIGGPFGPILLVGWCNSI